MCGNVFRIVSDQYIMQIVIDEVDDVILLAHSIVLPIDSVSVRDNADRRKAVMHV